MSDVQNKEKQSLIRTLKEVLIGTGVLIFDLAVVRHLLTLANPVVALAEAVGLVAVNKWAFNRWAKRNRS